MHNENRFVDTFRGHNIRPNDDALVQTDLNCLYNQLCVATKCSHTYRILEQIRTESEVLIACQ